jgi:hypothetical protein
VSKKSLGHSADASLGRFRIENVGGEVDPEPAVDLEADVMILKNTYFRRKNGVLTQNKL